MAIEIIKPGVFYEDRLFELTCRSCRARLRFKGSDTTTGDASGIEWVTCPQCGARTNAAAAKDITDPPDPMMGQQTIWQGQPAKDWQTS